MKSLLSGLFLIGFGVFLSLIPAELIARRVVSLKTTAYRGDDQVLYEFIPNATKSFTRLSENGGQTIEMAINSRGYRGPELASAKEGKRIVVYGDFYIEAQYSPFEQHL